MKNECKNKNYIMNETKPNWQSEPVVVLGATGKTGSQVLNFLSQAGISSRAFTRDLNKSKVLPFCGVGAGRFKRQEHGI